MKKLILTAAAAMMVLASCTKTKVESIDGPKEIAFKKIEGAMTKAEPTLLKGTMGVFAYLHGTTTPYFGNTSFSQVTGKTYWAGGKYWPLNDQALDFVVYAPHTDNIPNYVIEYASNNRTLTFTIPDNKSSQIDYLYGAEYFNNQTGAGGNGYTNPKNDTPTGVNLKHALAKITVQVNANANNVFTITNMTLNNTEQGGTIEVEYDGSTDVASVTSCRATSEGTSDEDIEMTLFDSATPVTTNVTDATTKSCLVFPGDYTDDTYNRYQTSFTITYTMEGLTTPLTTKLNLQADPSNPTSTWDSGKHYIYNLTLKANEILFNPTVIDWDPSTTINQDITQIGDVDLDL